MILTNKLHSRLLAGFSARRYYAQGMVYTGQDPELLPSDEFEKKKPEIIAAVLKLLLLTLARSCTDCFEYRSLPFSQ